jgi:hypothetical protein
LGPPPRGPFSFAFGCLLRPENAAKAHTVSSGKLMQKGPDSSSAAFLHGTVHPAFQRLVDKL